MQSLILLPKEVQRQMTPPPGGGIPQPAFPLLELEPSAFGCLSGKMGGDFPGLGPINLPDVERGMASTVGERRSFASEGRRHRFGMLPGAPHRYETGEAESRPFSRADR